MLIDTHCHLDASDFSPDRDAVALAARQAGIEKIIIPAVAPDTFSAVRACCARYPGCFPAYGIHPLFVDRIDDKALSGLAAWIDAELRGPYPPVAIGEIGLDFYRPGFAAERQKEFFHAQLRLAADFALPVLLHVRSAVDAVLDGLRQTGTSRGIAHAFNGSRQQAERFIKRGFYLGFGGAMTYPSAIRIRQLASTLPLESIVLETDAPDMPPVWLAGQRNTPCQLLRIAQTLAELRSQALDEITRLTAANAAQIIVPCCGKAAHIGLFTGKTTESGGASRHNTPGSCRKGEKPG